MAKSRIFYLANMSFNAIPENKFWRKFSNLQYHLKTADPDQLASSEASLSGSTLFFVLHMNLWQ